MSGEDALPAAFDRLIYLLNARCDQIEQHIHMVHESIQPPVLNARQQIEALKKDLANELEALAPLRPLLEDDSITDILINGPNHVYVEKGGRLQETGIVFGDDLQLWKIGTDIAARVGRFLDPDRPIVDARLSDGSRVNIVTQPLALDGTIISIRKFGKNVLTLDDIAKSGAMSQEMAELLKVAAACKLSILVAGGTGSGKTTMLNAISQYIEPSSRVVTIEDSAELRLGIPHKVRMESKPHVYGMPEYTEVTIRDLVKNALRMRPDRIIVGETRGPEAFDMIQAMNTGHEGSMTTVHANSPRDAFSRLENMIMMAISSLPQKAIRQQISSAVDLIVMVRRKRDGTRKVTSITEVTGMEGDMIVTQDLFEFKDDGDDANGKVKGSYKSSGIMPRFSKSAIRHGYKDKLAEIFKMRI